MSNYFDLLSLVHVCSLGGATAALSWITVVDVADIASVCHWPHVVDMREAYCDWAGSSVRPEEGGRVGDRRHTVHLRDGQDAV